MVETILIVKYLLFGITSWGIILLVLIDHLVKNKVLKNPKNHFFD